MSSLAAVGARGAVTAFLAQGTTLVVRLVSVIVLARLLVPEYFGLVAIVVALTEFASGVIDFGLPLAAVQAQSLSARAKSTLFLVNGLLGLVFAGVFLVGAEYIANIYGDHRLTDIVRWLALVPLVVGLSAQFRAQLMRNLRFISLELIIASTRIVGIVAAITVAATTGSVFALVILASIPPALQLPWLAIVAHWRPGRPGSWTESRQVIAVGSRIFGLNLLRNISRTAAVPALGLVESPRNVGFYDRAYQLSATPANALMDSLQRIAVSILSRVRSDRQKLQSSFEVVHTAASMALVSGTWVIGALGEPLVVLALGDEWLLAGQVMQFLAVGAGFRLMGMMEQWLFIAGQATGLGLVFSAWAQPLVMLISLAGLPWGMFGVAATSALAWAVFWPLSTVAATKATGLNGRVILKKSAITAISFCTPVALSAALPRIFLKDPIPVVIVGLSLAVVVACVLTLVRPSLRGAVNEIVIAIIGNRSGNR